MPCSTMSCRKLIQTRYLLLCETSWCPCL
jgi:hypothetical protein